MKIYKKAILPLGFKASGVASGIKRSGKLDLALFYSDAPARAACVFTANKVQAAPLILNKRYLKANRDFRAVIVNSGNANCFTGKAGMHDAQQISTLVAKTLGIKKEAVLSASTGIIGKPLPKDKIKKAIPGLIDNLSGAGIDKAKQAILTTDTFSKEITVRFNIGKRIVNVCGIAKGSGMIAPDMATMLCFIFTDACITRASLRKALKIAVDNSFNSITVDGCMSTNDMAIILANRKAENPLINTGGNFALFSRALNTVCLELAKKIIRDAEGATKFIRIKVSNAKSADDAKKAALSIANSNLFKTAMFASSPNVSGRIIAAIGASAVDFKEGGPKVKFSPLHKKEVNIDVSLGCGKAGAVIYTSDLTYEYVKINAKYN